MFTRLKVPDKELSGPETIGLRRMRLEGNHFGTVRQLVAGMSCEAGVRRLYRRLESVPLLGGVARGIARRTLPAGTRTWLQVRSGLAEGLWLRIDPRYEEQYIQGQYEAAVQRVLAEHVTSGSIFYDVGAHIGFFSLVGARLVERQGAVYCFEADPENAARVEQHIARNGFSQLQLLSVAVWSKSGVLAFEQASELSSRNTGHVVEQDKARNVVRVRAITLDEFAQTHRPPNFIKIDVEGAEMAVLDGAKRVLTESRPVILCEVHSEQQRISVEAVFMRTRFDFEWLSEAAFPRLLLARPLP